MTTLVKPFEKKQPFTDTSCLWEDNLENNHNLKEPLLTLIPLCTQFSIAESTNPDKSDLRGKSCFVHCCKCQEELGETEQFTSRQTREQREERPADFLLPVFK